MKNKILISLITLLLVGTVFGLIQLDKPIYLNEEIKNNLTQIGITNPIISSCEKIDNYTCKSTIYEKDGINKEIKVVYKFCDEYIFEEVNDTCKTHEQIAYNGSCINETINKNNQTECLEYEILYQNGICLIYNTKFVQTNECDIWKTLNQTEIEDKILVQTKQLLNQIADIQFQRNSVKEVLTDEIQLEIKEKTKDLKL